MTGPVVRATRDVAAYAAGVIPKTIDVWVSRGCIPHPVDGLYDLAGVLRWVERRDVHHAKINASRYNTPLTTTRRDIRPSCSVTNAGVVRTQNQQWPGAWVDWVRQELTSVAAADATGFTRSAIWDSTEGTDFRDLLDAEARMLLPHVNVLDLVHAIKVLEQFGYDRTDPDVISRAVRRAYMVTAADPLEDAGKWADAAAGAYAAQGQVYYADMGRHIKIGYSTNLEQRRVGLRVPRSAFLATEPGSPDLERMRHRQFAESRIGRWENFCKSPDLLAHVAAVRREFGEPRITGYIRTPQLADLHAAGAVRHNAWEPQGV